MAGITNNFYSGGGRRRGARKGGKSGGKNGGKAGGNGGGGGGDQPRILSSCKYLPIIPPPSHPHQPLLQPSHLILHHIPTNPFYHHLIWSFDRFIHT
jgi:hypothetical protein